MTMFKTDTRTLGAMLGALQNQDCRPRPVAIARTVSAAVKRGWAANYQCEDLLHDMGASRFWTEMDIAALFGIRRQTVFSRPKARGAFATGFDEIAVADLAYLLIQIEQLGLGIDPAPLVEALRPPLLRRPMLTKSELAIFWYARERHRCDPVLIEAGTRLGGLRPEKLNLSTGYKVEAWRNAAGEVGSILIAAPKYRRPRR